MLISLVSTLILYPSVADGDVARWSTAWAPDLDLGFGLRLDGFSWLFLLLINGIGLLVSGLIRRR